MPKINTIATVPVPKLSDKLVGTSVGGTPVNQTNNFTLQQLKTLFDGTPVSPNLQAVLNAGNTAIQNIYLTGTIAATNATIANDASSKNLYLSERLFDRNNFQGTNGQYLISTGTGVQWSTLTIATPTLQQVLTAGNISDKDIITTGNIQGANIQGTNVTVNSNLRVIGAIADSTNSFGTSGQVLSSTVTGTDWVDLPSYSAVSPLIYNNISRQFSIQQATGTQNGYLSSADWITFNGKQNAGNYITELTGEASALGPGAVNITLNNLAVINKTLTGLAISSGVITAADSIITAFGKIQGQINGIVAGVVYKGAWNAATNTPTLTSSVGVQGNYYVVDVAGNTNLNGITDWQVGDWAIYNGSVWQKVDNTDAVTSVNGQTGIVVLNTDNISEGTTNLYYLNSRARAAISSVATGLTYTSSTGVFSLTSGYSIPTVANQTNWTTAYNDSIVSAAVTGTTTKTLTLTQQDGGTITASWTDIDTNLVTSVFGRTGAVVAQAGDYSTTLVTEGTNLYYLDSRARASISSSATGLTYTTATGVFSFTSGYSIPTDASQSNWTTAYNDSIVSAAVTGTTTKTLTLNQQDGGTITASWTDLDTGLTSVGVSMPSAFNVTNSPLTSNGTIAVTGAGTAAQYVRGDGTLGDFPTGGGGGGASVSYYLNGSINQGSFGGNTYYQMSKTPILGAGTDFSTSTNGYITQFITDVGTPDALLIPGGNWNFETYFSASSGGGSPTFYIELYKYDGATFTLIASNSSNPELIAFGTTINPYYNSLAVPETVLTINDRLAIRIYVFTSGRTITLHTEDNHLCQAITTFTTGLTALNGLTKQIQYFAVGTSGSDFNISSSVATHTFNLPTASATNRGALSSSDWTTFNNKIGGTLATGQVAFGTAANTIGGGNNLFWDNVNGRFGVGTSTPSSRAEIAQTSTGNLDYLTIYNSGGGAVNDQTALSFEHGGNRRSNKIFSTLESSTSTALGFVTTASTVEAERWRITSTGILQSNGAQTIQTSTGNLTLATAGGNGNIILSPNGTGVVAIGTTSFQNIQSATLNVGSNRGAVTIGLSGIQDDGTFIDLSYQRPMTFSFGTMTSNSEAMRLTSANNLLIGTTTDAGFRLDVNGTARVQGNLNVSTGGITLTGAQTIQTSTGNLTLATAGGNGNILLTPNGTGVVDVIKNDRALGAELRITNSANSSSWIAGDVVGTLNFVSTDSSTTQPIRSQIQSISTAGTTYPAAMNLTFSTANANTLTEGFRLTTLSNLLVGTTTDSGFRLDINGTTRLNGLQTFQGTTASDTAPLGSELTTTGTGTNWTGTDFATGYTHVVGSTASLTTSLAAIVGTYYQITYTVTGRTAGTFTINFGGTSTVGITATGNTGPVATTTANLEIVPTSGFDGTIVLSVRTISNASATTSFTTSGGTVVNEIRANNTGSNTFVGLNTGRRNTTGSNNTFFGMNSGVNNTTGLANTFVGRGSGFTNSIGFNNSFFGISSGFANTTGSNNSFFGRESGFNNTTGISNSFFGTNSGQSNTTGTSNSFFGVNAGASSTTGIQNTFLGVDTAANLSTGSNNLMAGVRAGRFIADGTTPVTIANNSVFLGFDTRANADNETNQIVIGHTAIGLGSNTTVLGNSSTTFGRWFGNLLLGTSTNVASSILTMSSTTQGFLPPRMTAAQRTAIASPAEGLIVFQTDSVIGLYIYANATWRTLGMI